MKNTHQTILIVFIILSNFLCTDSFAGKPPYPEDAHSLTLKILDLMVLEGVCKSRNNCGGREFVFRDGGANDIDILVFRSRDLEPSVINKIIVLSTKEYFFYEQKKTIRLKIYKETIQERNAWFSGVEPSINLVLKGYQ